MKFLKFFRNNYPIFLLVASFIGLWLIGQYFDNPYNLGVKLPPNLLTQDKNVICVPGYASSVRNVPESLKKKVAQRDNKDWPPNGKYVIDHKINLGIGGSNDISNLTSQETFEARMKDRVEVYLQNQVCDGKMSVKDAQREIKDWKGVLGVKDNLGGVIICEEGEDCV